MIGLFLPDDDDDDDDDADDHDETMSHEDDVE